MNSQINLSGNFIFQVPWDLHNGTTYKYGAEIEVVKSAITYSNPMMAQAVKINTWYSETSYPNNRFSPTLPLLKSGHDYCLIADYQSKPNKSIFLQIDFLDLYGHKIDSIINDSGLIEFNFPNSATSYQISIINASCKFLWFDKLMIFETSPEMTDYYYDSDKFLILSKKNKKQLATLSFNNYNQQLVSLPENVNTEYIISDPKLNFETLNDMLQNNQRELLDNLLNYINSTNSKITLIGYQLFDSVLAIMISQLLPLSRLVIFDKFEEQLNQINPLSVTSNKILLDIFHEQKFNGKENLIK